MFIWGTFHNIWVNPLSPQSDQHQISSCNINALQHQCFVKQTGHVEYPVRVINFLWLLFKDACLDYILISVNCNKSFGVCLQIVRLVT